MFRFFESTVNMSFHKFSNLVDNEPKTLLYSFAASMLGYSSMAIGLVRNASEIMELSYGEVLDLNSTDELLVYGGLTMALASSFYIAQAVYRQPTQQPQEDQDDTIPVNPHAKSARNKM